MLLRLFLILIIALSVSAGSAGPVYDGKVVGVSDGDTLIVLTPEKQQIKVRLAEIDAPEKSQAFGQRAKQSLSDLVFGKQVRIEQQDRDWYGRVVGKAYVGSLDVNAEQVKRGMARVYRKYAKDRALFKLEEEARSARRGLWSDPHAIPPWAYRHGGRADPPAGSKSAQALAKAKARSSHPCGAKRYCNEMTSCEEARFYLTQCSLTSLDRDGDDVPCESLCR
jgi:endonuclease YncB( thermonuclease family)